MPDQRAISKEIEIILNDSVHAKDFKPENLIHKREFEKVINLIEGAIPYSEDDANKKYLHNTITILGTRGSGKTSFLLSIEKAITRADHDRKGKMLKDIQVLDIIDPTLIEEKAHVFLNVISAISELVEKKLDEIECMPGKEERYKRKDWRNKLTKLAAGLPSIGGIGSSRIENWQDPEFVMDNGLKAVTASRNLADNFNNFLKISLDILGKKTFLLMFDDIDVDATKGWTVLETIRKYFTSARLITLLSGDLRLYSAVIRQKKWKNFGEEILRYEGTEQKLPDGNIEKLNTFHRMVTELTAQYLLKIMQPKYRIHLLTLLERKHDESGIADVYVYKNVQEAHANNGKEQYKIFNHYIGILKHFGVFNTFQAKTYHSFLLGQPLRTQIQFMSLFESNENGYKLKENRSAQLTDIFLSDLSGKEVDTDLVLRSPKYLNTITLKLLLHEKKLEEAYQLQPNTTDNSLNASLTTLSFLMAHNIQKGNFYLIFDYLIRVGYIRNLLPSIGYDEKGAGLANPSIEGLCINAAVMNDGVLRDTVGKIVAYVRGYIDKIHSSKSENMTWGGTIPLFGEANKSKRRIDFTSDRIDRVLKDNLASAIQKTLVYIPLSSNKYSRKQSSLLTYSIYLLIGAIGELIRRGTKNEIGNGISELSQLRSYIMPDFSTGNSEIDIQITGDDDPDSTGDLNNPDFVLEDLFQKWKENGTSVLNASPHLLGKISTRFFYAIGNFENENSNKMLGEMFHAQVVALMNAILIEDVRENADSIAGLNLNNTNYRDTVFINNLKSQTKIFSNEAIIAQEVRRIDQLRLSRWLLSCPLFIAYLKNDSKNELKNALKAYCESFIDEQSFNVLSVYKLLNKVAIKEDKTLPKDDKLINLSLKKANFDEIAKRLKNAGVLSVFASETYGANAQNILAENGISGIRVPGIMRFRDYLKENGEI